jgi:hypothetical protein
MIRTGATGLLPNVADISLTNLRPICSVREGSLSEIMAEIAHISYCRFVSWNVSYLQESEASSSVGLRFAARTDLESMHDAAAACTKQVQGGVCTWCDTAFVL